MGCWRLAAVGVAIGVAVVAGCGPTSSSGGSGTPAGGSLPISEGTFSGIWPFTVQEGTLRCESGAVIFNANGTDYGVNETALDEGLPEINPILKENSSGLGGPRVFVGDVLVRGLILCKA